MDTIATIGPDNHYLFNLINFLERFVAQIQAPPISLPNHDICKKFDKAGDDLMKEYQSRLEKQIMIW